MEWSIWEGEGVKREIYYYLVNEKAKQMGKEKRWRKEGGVDGDAEGGLNRDPTQVESKLCMFDLLFFFELFIIVLQHRL